jgi:hypothetical protein
MPYVFGNSEDRIIDMQMKFQPGMLKSSISMTFRISGTPLEYKQ